MKSFLSLIFLLFFIIFGASLAWRARPIMKKNETYNSFFPKEKFLARISSDVPDWMIGQLEADFKDTGRLTVNRIQKVYETIANRVPEQSCCHYRILNNQLYKYSARKGAVASRDTLAEKALKTLLCQISVPDLDFILIPMDGIPEKHMPPDFYLMERIEEQVPILGQAKLKEPKTRSVVLIPSLICLSESWYEMAGEILSINGSIPWKEKKGGAFWRGGTSDVPVNEKNNPLFLRTPRWNLCALAQRAPEYVNARFYTADSPMLFATAEQEHLLSSFISKLDHLKYKYLPDLDGHMCSSPGLLWRLLSDSLTLKQESDQVQWFHAAISPYVHYLPLANEMNDVIEKVKWAEAHEKETRHMIENANKFVSNHLMYEDCYRYLYLVLQKYSTYQDIDFKELKTQTNKDPHWINIHYRKRAEFYQMLRRKVGLR